MCVLSGVFTLKCRKQLCIIQLFFLLLLPPPSDFRSSQVLAGRRKVLSNAYVMFLSFLLKVMLIFDVGFFYVIYFLFSSFSFCFPFSLLLWFNYFYFLQLVSLYISYSSFLISCLPSLPSFQLPIFFLSFLALPVVSCWIYASFDESFSSVSVSYGKQNTEETYDQRSKCAFMFFSIKYLKCFSHFQFYHFRVLEVIYVSFPVYS
jgi:hypothetical protein